eukprot:g17353.t1
MNMTVLACEFIVHQKSLGLVALDHKGNAHLYQYTPHSDGREGDWVEAGAAVDYNRLQTEQGIQSLMMAAGGGEIYGIRPIDDQDPTSETNHCRVGQSIARHIEPSPLCLACSLLVCHSAAAERPNHLGADPVIALDYHQVLDVDRSVNPPDRVDHVGNLPAGHVAAVRRLRQEIEEWGLHCRVKVIVLSHIHDSVVNERNLITAVQQSSLSVDCVIITRERTGPGGKFEVLRSLTRGQSVILDDNTEVLREFSEASLIAIQIRKPRVAAILKVKSKGLGACRRLGWLIDWCDSCSTIRPLAIEIASKPHLAG